MKPNGSQLGFPSGVSTSGVFGLYGEKYGWLVEIDPKHPHERAKKHTALGRFRHENIAMRAEPWHRLVAYMGDDRRGGHVWKFVSDRIVRHPGDPGNSELLERGTLYVAKFDADGSGTWIPLLLSTPTHPAAFVAQPLGDGGASPPAYAPSGGFGRGSPLPGIARCEC